MAAVPPRQPRTMEIRYGERYLLVLYGISLQNVKEQIQNHCELPGDTTVQIGIEKLRDGQRDFVEITGDLWDVVWDIPDVKNAVVARIKERQIPVGAGLARPTIPERRPGQVPPFPPPAPTPRSPSMDAISIDEEDVSDVPRRGSTSMDNLPGPEQLLGKNEGREKSTRPLPPDSIWIKFGPRDQRGPGQRGDPIGRRRCILCKKIRYHARTRVSCLTTYSRKELEAETMLCLDCREKVRNHTSEESLWM
ncbi:hypothetical protein FRC19_008665 [Serendipita sp. 401]|nr:hypothetical protein FRC19_008665 [Serendipita sp. 401]